MAGINYANLQHKIRNRLHLSSVERRLMIVGTDKKGRRAFRRQEGFLPYPKSVIDQGTTVVTEQEFRQYYPDYPIED